MQLQSLIMHLISLISAEILRSFESRFIWTFPEAQSEARSPVCPGGGSIERLKLHFRWFLFKKEDRSQTLVLEKCIPYLRRSITLSTCNNCSGQCSSQINKTNSVHNKNIKNDLTPGLFVIIRRNEVCFSLSFEQVKQKKKLILTERERKSLEFVTIIQTKLKQAN